MNKHVHLTWYVLADGTHADPNDCAPGEDGVLRHENGVPVALHEDGTPMSVGKAADEGNNVEAAQRPPAQLQSEPKDVKPAKPKGGYKTRETKAR